MKKLYYLFALIGIVACSEPLDVYDGDLSVDGSESNVAYIYYETGGSSSLSDKFAQYFGENYADRTNLKVVLSGTMSVSDFADIKGLSILDMSDVTLTDRTIPSNAFQNATLDSLTLPTTGSLIMIEEDAFAGTNLIELSIPTSVLRVASNIFDEDNTSLQTINFYWEEGDELPTLSDGFIPERFLKQDDDTTTSSTDEEEVSYTISVPSGGMYVYKQSDYWSQYNLKERATTDGSEVQTIIVYVQSAVATTESAVKPMLESEIIDLLGDLGEDYAATEGLDLIIKGELVEDDFNVLRYSMFNSVDFSEATIVGTVLVEGANMGGSDVDTYCYGNAIPDSAFIENVYLTRVVIPASVEYIGNAAFKACSNLVDISFADGVQSNLKGLYSSAFSQCTSLESPDFLLSTEIEMICDKVFSGCTSITGMTVPKSVDSLGITIIDASDVCAYVYLKWEENPLTCNTDTPPFPNQFVFGGDEFITIPDDTKDIYERAGWGYYNLKEQSQTVSSTKMWTRTFTDYFDDQDYTGFYWDHHDGYYDSDLYWKDDNYDYTVSYFTDDNWYILRDAAAEVGDTANDGGNVTDGHYLVIESKKEAVWNRDYVENSSDWNTSDLLSEYTSSRLTSTYGFMYGRIKVRAKLPYGNGAWPSVSTYGYNPAKTSNSTGYGQDYQYGGTVDIAMYSGGSYLAAFTWNGHGSSKNPETSIYSDLIEDPDAFHTWLYDWSDTQLDIYLYDNVRNEHGVYDSTLVHSVSTSQTLNWNWLTTATNPFTSYTQFPIITLALGTKGGDVTDDTNMPKFIIDYIEIWEDYWVYYDFD